MKHIVSSMLAKLDLKLTHNRSDTWSPTIDILSIVGDRVLDSIPSPRILQIGANDGQANDWLRPFVAREDSVSILVEPLPAPFAKLESLYRERSNVQCVRAAMAQSSGELTMYHAHFEGECPARFTRVASLKPRIISKHRRHIRAAGGAIRPLSVPAVTAQSLIAMFDSGPDIVGVDAEGFDTTAVRLLIEAGARPAMIVYEHCHSRGDDDELCRRALSDTGYLLARVNRDTLAVASDLWSGV